MERLLAEIRTSQTKIEANDETVEVLRERTVDHHKGVNAGHEETKTMLEACLEKTEANPEEIKSVAENQEVPNEEAAVNTIGIR